MQDPMSSVTPAQYARAYASWQDDSPVPSAADASLTLPLTSLPALRAVRRQVRTFLRDSLRTSEGTADEEVEPTTLDTTLDEAVMVIDELTSNALRHGSAPSSLHLCDEEGRWIAIVSDGAPDLRPTPATDRPVGGGGYGLYLVADLSNAHGVHYEPDCKLVWACISKTR